jgi:hypothetical protein
VNKHRVVNGVQHGDHCCDAARYSYEDLRHFVSQLRPPPPPAKTEEEQLDDELDEPQRGDEYEWLR